MVSNRSYREALPQEVVGEEGDLIRQIQEIFEDEKLQFYCCGGSGTMSNVLNGFDSLENVELLRDFENDNRQEQLTKFYEERDWKNYSVVVHALKGVSRTLGFADFVLKIWR